MCSPLPCAHIEIVFDHKVRFAPKVRYAPHTVLCKRMALTGMMSSGPHENFTQEESHPYYDLYSELL